MSRLSQFHFMPRGLGLSPHVRVQLPEIQIQVRADPNGLCRACLLSAKSNDFLREYDGISISDNEI